MRRLDSGSEPFFGDLTVVFNSHLPQCPCCRRLCGEVSESLNKMNETAQVAV